MSSKLLNRLLIAAVVLLLAGLAGGAYSVNKLFSRHADQLTKLKAKSQALDEEQVQLKKAKQDIAQYAKLQQIAQTVVPEDKNQAQAIREIVNIAAANEVKLSSVSFTASTLGATSGIVKSGDQAAAAAPVPKPDSPASKLSQLLPVKNIPGVYQLPIVVTSDTNQPVRYDKFVSFLQALEHNRRTAQVSAITLQPLVNNRSSLTFTLTVNGYIKP
jgi:Tfp pilus assembly protein FimV